LLFHRFFELAQLYLLGCIICIFVVS